MKIFHFLMVKPSHYDDDGYVIQWLRSIMPSNTLAAIYGLAVDCAERQVLGEDVELRFTTIDETNTRVNVKKLARRVKRDGGHGLVGLVGVQSNQYPRALDLARQFRAHGLPVCIGGFHVSGCLAMLEGLTPELQEALDLGISLFAGEAEGRLEAVLGDAYRSELKPIYNYMNDLPPIANVPPPILPAERVKRTVASVSSFDAGRGCPFRCSFCTIINVQGRSSRYRNADDIERIIRDNVRQGVTRFLVSDDNFARNQNWELIFDRLIELRRGEGLEFKLTLQVDTLCHKIPNFIEKAQLAGVKRVFIGLENINPETLKNAKKPQNRITEYRRMLQAWRSIGVLTIAGYIVGFPGDTAESIVHDVEIIKRELPIDILEFFILTPLPGSEDHKILVDKGVAMDPDLNKYDVNHVTTAHDSMSQAEWERACRLAWDTYYTPEHVETLLKRARATGVSVSAVLSAAVGFYHSILWEGVHPLESGYLRLRFRKDRRPGLPIEKPWVFYPKHLRSVIGSAFRAARTNQRYLRVRRRLKADPKALEYRDLAITPVTDDELDELELFQASESAQLVASKAQEKIRATGAGRAEAG